MVIINLVVIQSINHPGARKPPDAAPFPTMGLTVPMTDTKGRRYECNVPDATDKQRSSSATKVDVDL